MAANSLVFKPRSLELQFLEGNYKDFILSCRHKDILRCSITKHFRSCYSPDGINKEIPFQLCCNPNAAIIGKKDRTGDWIWRAFIKISKTYEGHTRITVYKIYGNHEVGIQTKIVNGLNLCKGTVKFSDFDA